LCAQQKLGRRRSDRTGEGLNDWIMDFGRGLTPAQALEHWGKDMVLIAVTGWGQDSDKRRALAAGFDQHLTKPIDPARLAKLAQN
jgi:CheY-like chemotaxis protein